MASKNEIQSPFVLPAPSDSLSTGTRDVAKKIAGRHYDQQRPEAELTMSSRAAQYTANA